MTILRVQHATTYRYRRPVAIGSHRLMVRPRDSHDLRLISTDLNCVPAATLNWSHDVFGNSVAHATFLQSADTLSITSRIVVEQYVPDTPAFTVSAAALCYPFVYAPDEYLDLGALLTPQYVDADGRLKAWADGLVPDSRMHTLALLKELNTRISACVSYQRRDDERTQGPLETLARGWGTCRDYAVLFAEAARVLGFGARVVSGYLYNPDAVLGDAQDKGSTHAWAEAYISGAGWIAFDPTNQTMGGTNLIRIAVARSIEQISPVSGSFTGVPDDFTGMDIAVSITPAEPDLTSV